MQTFFRRYFLFKKVLSFSIWNEILSTGIKKKNINIFADVDREEMILKKKPFQIVFIAAYF